MLLSPSKAPHPARYLSLLESTPEALMLGDGAGRVLEANQQTLDLFGYTLDELQNGPTWMLCDATDPRFHESVHTRAASGRSDFQMRLRRKDGSVFEARIWSVLFDEDGERRSWIGVHPLGVGETASGVLLRANAMLSSVIASAPDGIIVIEDGGSVVHVNHVFLKMWNLDPTFALLPPHMRRAQAMPLLKDPGQFTREMDALTADHDLVLSDRFELVDGRTLEMHSQPLNDPGGERIGRIWFYRDVTAVLAARTELAHSDALLEAQFALSQDGMLVLGDDGEILRASKHFQDLIHNGRRWIELSFEEREAALTEMAADESQSKAFNKRWLSNPLARIEETFEMRNGDWMEIRTLPLVTGSGERLGRLFVYRDVTKRRQDMLALESANTLLSAQFEHAPHATLVLAKDGAFIRASDSFYEFSGLPREWADLPILERRAQLEALSVDSAKSSAFNERWRERQEEDLTSEFQLRDGRFFEVRARLLISSDGELLGRIFFYTDITERRKAEIVLRESEHQLQALLAALEEGVVLFDAAGQVVLSNAAALRVLGVGADELSARVGTGQRWAAIREDGTPFPEGEFPVDVAMRHAATVNNVVAGVARGNGDSAWLLVNCAPLFDEDGRTVAGAVASFVDITERRKLEASAARLRQHESLAVLAGGVSHKLNNLLTSIIGNAWVAAQMPNLPNELRESVSDISDAAESAAALVGDLRSFAAPSYLLSPSVAVNDCVRAAVAEVPADRRERLALNLGAALPHISANADGLRRVLVNLIENAFDAGSPIVEVRTRFVEWQPSPEVVFSANEPSAGEWLVIEVEDHGRGMDKGHVERAFEPFFTTGFAGSGLGLPAAMGIVREHGGYLGLESSPGEGTTARIFLPRGI